MRFPVLVAVALFGSPALAQSVWVVDPFDPGADFHDIQSAVNAAASGDTVVVRTGTYSNIEVEGKSLSIVADEEAVASVGGSTSSGKPFVRVANVPPGDTVVIRGLTVFSGQVFSAFDGVVLEDNDGTVWLEDFDLQMFHPFSTGIGDVHGIRALRSASVVLVECTVEGHRASDALIVQEADVVVYGGKYDGGPGSNDGAAPPVVFDGGDGMRLESGQVFASGAEFEGGVGGDTVFLFCPAPSDGGNGVTVLGGVFRDLDAAFAAGAGGSGAPCGLPDGTAGSGVAELGGSRETIAESARGLVATPAVYEGKVLSQTFTAAPFELAFTDTGFGTAPPVFVPSVAAPVLLTSPVFFRLRGVVGADGTLVKAFTLQELGLAGLTVYFQPVFIDAGSLTVRFGAATASTLMDASFAP